MSTNEIRLKFLNFFKSKGHTIVASDSLVPKDDPTVLFTTAGMQQFKPQFLGRDLTYTRATTCQKCLRTDDLDVVGKTDFHHTFFEMLGNFSFGDYFKKEAIAWGWEFLTQELKLPKEKLWVSVYKDDEEAYGIWLNDIKIPQEKIVRLGDKSNFWPSNAKLNGPNGPCGPCSEIFYDYGVNPNCPNGAKCDPDCSCGRFSEIWNLVFTQFNRKEGGVLEPLPAKNIDTGMGLERLAAVVQGKKSNYETDNFVRIIQKIDEIAGEKSVNLTREEKRIIADHIRAIVFAVADGVIPSNKERGSVVKKLITTIADIMLRKTGMTFGYSLVPTVVALMGDVYPELLKEEGELPFASYVRLAEQYYEKVYTTQIPRLKEQILSINSRGSQNGNNNEIGHIVFYMRDTDGLTLNTIKSVLSEMNISGKDLKEIFDVYQQLMKEQQERSRASSKMTGDVFSDGGLKLDVPKTEFLGYSTLEADATALKVIAEGKNIKVILDRTPFYAESGGQVGDTGSIENANVMIKVVDTQKMNDIFIHTGTIERGELKSGDKVRAVVDKDRRREIIRNHTATHLLQSALRETLGTHIKQQGSLVTPSRLRFDFTHPMGVKPDEIQKIEKRLEQFIQKADKIITEVLPLEEAKKKGALAFFAEKYGNTVRVVSIGDYSTEFCGGTHVEKTADIEAVKIVSEGSVAQGIRRVEAVTGQAAVDDFLKQKQAEEKLKEEQLRLRQIEKEKQKARFEVIKSSVSEIVEKAQKIKDMNVVTYCFDDIDMDMLRKLSDLLKQKLASGVFVLGAKTNEDASLVVSVTDDLVAKGVKANEIIGRLAPLFGANGGGRPQLAQAGSKEPQKLEGAIAQAKDLVQI